MGKLKLLVLLPLLLLAGCKSEGKYWGTKRSFLSSNPVVIKDSLHSEFYNSYMSYTVWRYGDKKADFCDIVYIPYEMDHKGVVSKIYYQLHNIINVYIATSVEYEKGGSYGYTY